MITENDMNELSKIIELPGEKKLFVVVEGRLPICYEYGQKGHIKNCASYTFRLAQTMQKFTMITK